MKFFLFALLGLSIFVISPAFALCEETPFGESIPCFDSFHVSQTSLTEELVMKEIYNNLDTNYKGWTQTERSWVNVDEEYTHPTIVCTAFDWKGQTHYRMLQWKDDHRLSSMEDYRNDSMCDKWLPPKITDYPVPSFNCNDAVKDQIPTDWKYHCYAEPMGNPLRDISLSKYDDPQRLEFILQHCQKHGSLDYVGELRYLNDTHLIDLDTCQWDTRSNSGVSLDRTVYPVPFSESKSDLEIAFDDFSNWIRVQIKVIFGALQNFSVIQYAYAGCAATIIPQPCFDSFMGSHEPLTEDIIMQNFGRYLETNYGSWESVNRDWDSSDESLDLPAIICTEYIVDNSKQYRMAQWIDAYKISSWENHYNPFMCNKWLAPIDDGIQVTWNEKTYPSNGQGLVTVIDSAMNKDQNNIDSFKIKVHSDTDHTGIMLTVTETTNNSGIFEGLVFFSYTEKSSGNQLLVEDAVYANHAKNSAKSRIEYVSDSANPLPDSNLQRYIDACDPLLHKDSLPDITIETETQWYDLQYCMWRPHYPDVSDIDNCVDLFDTLYAFHNAPKPSCGLQRYNEDGTPRGICEPEPYLASMWTDENLINSQCTENYAEWAYKTDANDKVFYVFDEMAKYQDRKLQRVLDRCEENNPNRSVRYFENYTHSIDSESCKWSHKEISSTEQAVALCVGENTILQDGVCIPIQPDEHCKVSHFMGFAIDECNPLLPYEIILLIIGWIGAIGVIIFVIKRK